MAVFQKKYEQPVSLVKEVSSRNPSLLLAFIASSFLLPLPFLFYFKYVN